VFIILYVKAKYKTRYTTTTTAAAAAATIRYK
jgi:hypothetical protein